MSIKKFSFPGSSFESGMYGLRDNTTGKYLGHVETMVRTELSGNIAIIDKIFVFG